MVVANSSSCSARMRGITVMTTPCVSGHPVGDFAFEVDGHVSMRGGMHVGSHVTRPFSTGGAAGRIANRPRNATGNTLAPIAHDPSGSTVTGSATNRTGG